MKLLFYSEEQDALRVYDTEWECWEDMRTIWPSCNYRHNSLVMLVSWGWELIGEI